MKKILFLVFLFLCTPFVLGLLDDGQLCLNDEDCVNGSCVEGTCGSFYKEISENIGLMDEILDIFKGIECNNESELENEGWKCEGSLFYSCGAGGAWEIGEEVEGECGVTVNDIPGGGNSQIRIVVVSPEEGVTYSTNKIRVDFYDSKNRARYWKYSLNNGSLFDLTLNKTITASYGNNTLVVYASRYNSFYNDYTKDVSFYVTSLSTVSSVCGNGVCEPNEGVSSCAVDCSSSVCGDGDCDSGESVSSCYSDCAPIGSVCGDGTCDSSDGESSSSCPEDCKAKKNNNYMWLFVLIVILFILVLMVVVGIILYKLKESDSLNGVEGFSGGPLGIDPKVQGGVPASRPKSFSPRAPRRRV